MKVRTWAEVATLPVPMAQTAIVKEVGQFRREFAR